MFCTSFSLRCALLAWGYKYISPSEKGIKSFIFIMRCETFITNAKIAFFGLNKYLLFSKIIFIFVPQKINRVTKY